MEEKNIDLYIHNTYTDIKVTLDVIDISLKYRLPHFIDINSLVFFDSSQIGEYELIKIVEPTSVIINDKIYNGELLQYDDNMVKINTNDGKIVIKNYDVLKIGKTKNYIQFSKPGIKTFLYRNDYIFYNISYTLYVENDKINSAVETLELISQKDQPFKFNNIFTVMGIKEEKCHISCKMDNNQITGSYIYDPSLGKYEYINKEKKEYNVYKLHYKNIVFKKGSKILLNKDIDLYGEKTYIINSNNQQKQIQYGYNILCKKDLYNGKAIFIDKKNNTIIGKTVIDRLVKNEIKTVILGTTDSILPIITKSVIKREENSKTVIYYKLSVTYYNFNKNKCRIQLEDKINTSYPYKFLNKPDYIKEGIAVWYNELLPESVKNVEYNYSIIEME